MTQIIDLGNGYGQLRAYHSPYANLHFQLTGCKIRGLYRRGYINRDEYFHWLSYLGYSSTDIKVFYSIDNIAPAIIVERKRLCQPPNVIV